MDLNEGHDHERCKREVGHRSMKCQLEGKRRLNLIPPVGRQTISSEFSKISGFTGMCTLERLTSEIRVRPRVILCFEMVFKQSARPRTELNDPASSFPLPHGRLYYKDAMFEGAT